MIFYVVGLCIYGVFDFFELLEQPRTRENVLFGIIFSAALILGVYYISAYHKPSLTRGLIDFLNLRNINY
jgi:ABC-type Mn2+/Zn2+ transport system permease subunit